MKFLLKTLGILLAIFILLKLLFYIFDSGHEISYSVGNFEEINIAFFKICDRMKTH